MYNRSSSGSQCEVHMNESSCREEQRTKVVLVSHIQRIGCQQPEKATVLYAVAAIPITVVSLIMLNSNVFRTFGFHCPPPSDTKSR